MTWLRQYGTTLLIIAVAVLLARGMQPYFDQTNIAMVYLLAVVLVAFLFGLGPGVLTCLLGVFLFDFVNLPPYFGFSDRTGEYLFTLGVMLVTAVVISSLAGRLRQKAAEAAEREARTAAQAIERHELQQQIHASELRIQQEQLRNSILNAISHDLRTPLATIQGASSSLMEEGDRFSPAARYRLRAMIYEESLHMQRMVENLLDLTRLQSGQIVLGREWQAIEEIVGSAVAVLKRRSKLRAVQVDVPADLPLIRCDNALLERVLVNLLENADRYSPADAVITVQADVFEGKMRLMIIDQGVGIPPEEQEKVFDPFYRLGQRGTGFGLGLTICRTIIEASGGEIWLRSALGAGTTVCLTLPIPPDAPAMQPESGLGPEA